jgi:hypothetical protein
MEPEKLFFFLHGPGVFGYSGREVVIPSLAALFSGSLRGRIFFLKFI